MEKFKYNLQKVLDFKIEVEEKKKDDYVKVYKRYISAQEKLNNLLKQKSEFENKKDLKSGIDCANYSRYFYYLQKTIDIENKNVEKIKSELLKKKDELIKSTSDRKMIENLKEKAKIEFDFEQNKKEQNQNDDFALFSYVRNERR
ncbi:flagellar FliJ protein [Caloramator quimbayensis]|uniref:Flagellar FliJ protein n=1 Tax=Caloramator quimbayensis TaxID=1147123 RepID=A0A1T4XB43_9CLOT|nr:flagellar export protein FliJ [Caloramator quimbayensis]SKA86365.1 flagellar FliJ protein [Caloramator quimbayensis]